MSRYMYLVMILAFVPWIIIYILLGVNVVSLILKYKNLASILSHLCLLYHFCQIYCIYRHYEPMYYTGIPHFIAFCFIVPHRCFAFLQIEGGKTLHQQKYYFIVILALLLWSGLKPALSLQYACNFGFK